MHLKQKVVLESLLRICFFSEFLVQIQDKSYDGILVILFEHNVSHIKFLIICLYLPPENSPWGRHLGPYSRRMSN